MDYHTYFCRYCHENNLDISLFFTMPVGYEDANGTFDPNGKTVYINMRRLDKIMKNCFFCFMSCATHPNIANQTDLTK